MLSCCHEIWAPLNKLVIVLADGQLKDICPVLTRLLDSALVIFHFSIYKQALI